MDFKDMNVFAQFRLSVIKALDQLVANDILPQGLSYDRVTCEPPKDVNHGDIATNAAMVLAKESRKNPRQIAEALVTELSNNSYVEKAEVAGPGFVNLRLSDSFWRDHLKLILQEVKAYGDSQMGKGKKANVEYVSVNPTGPMHVGHSRVAIVGDVLASLLQKAGFEVTKEFYINDAGAQTIKLAQSVYNRYLEALGHTIEDIGEYPGDYIIPVGKALAEKEGDRLLNFPEEKWMPIVRLFAIE
jgi:arginyl-tRNA synthetase